MHPTEYLFEVTYHWQDGYGQWYHESVYVVAENDSDAAEKAQEKTDMPYGVNGVECLGVCKYFRNRSVR